MQELELFVDDPVIPDGFEAVYECPDVKDHKSLIGSTILFRWDCGWSQGIIKQRHTRGTVFNYFVQYVEPDGTTVQYRHGLRESNYYNDDNSDGLWFVIEKEEP